MYELEHEARQAFVIQINLVQPLIRDPYSLCVSKGNSGAAVIVGSEVCEIQMHDTSQMLTCFLPAGVSDSASIILIQVRIALFSASVSVCLHLANSNKRLIRLTFSLKLL